MTPDIFNLHCFRRRAFFGLGVVVALVSGCLPRDPDSKAGASDEGEAAFRARLEAVNPETRAPKSLDPDIRARRAFGEAPMLAERVARGELPPVSERLPDNPLVVVPVEEIGVYGGTIRRAVTSDVYNPTGIHKTLNDAIMGFERPLPNSIQPNLAESYEFQDEGRTAIFRLRKGLKWSDGAPVTVDDILFWYHDMVLDQDARTSPANPARWFVDGEPIRMEKIDDLTLKVSSPQPLGLVLHSLCHDETLYPRHVLSKLHPRHNPDATYTEFRRRATYARLVVDPNIPRVSAWRPVEWIPGQRVVYERNPYYWKIDSAGNQLPYADQLVFEIIPESQVILLKFLNGELDLFGRYATLGMAPALLAQERRRGNIRVLFAGPEPGTGLLLNWDTPNPHLRAAFRDLLVRRALSHALNRREISKIAYFGLMEPGGAVFARYHPVFNEEDNQLNTEFDPDKARALLDEAGYHDLNGDGYRQFSDGSRFDITIDIQIAGDHADLGELIVDYWGDIGIKVFLNIGKEDIIYDRRISGKFEIYVWELGFASNPLDGPHNVAALGPMLPPWHRSASEEGPEWLLESTDLIRKAMTTVDLPQQLAHVARVQRLFAENIPYIPTGSIYYPWGANSRLGNVPPKILRDNSTRGWSRPVYHEQLFFRP